MAIIYNLYPRNKIVSLRFSICSIGVSLLLLLVHGCSKDWDKLVELTKLDGSTDNRDVESIENDRDGSTKKPDADKIEGSVADATIDLNAQRTDANIKDTTPDGCDEGCDGATCGDGIQDDNEECDDGDDNSDSDADACRTDCTQASCGDGVRDDGEECDDGDDNSDSEADACRTDCAQASCGDGTRDDGEECDDGDDNSDSGADACRTDCKSSYCGDDVRDDGEECDDGEDNSDTEADACRPNCKTPYCGDSVTDSGEECDDGNSVWGDTCYDCSARYYFILNSPAINSSGDNSITRVDKRGHSTVIIEPSASMNGARELELEPDGSVLYVLQYNYSLSLFRLLYIDPLTGDEVDEVNLDAASLGYTSSGPTAMARGYVNGLLYIIVIESSVEVHMISVDPETKAIATIIDFAETFGSTDMTRDDDGNFYLTSGSQIRKMSAAFKTVSIFADSSDGFSSASGITYDDASDTIWVADSPSSSAGRIWKFTTAGVGTLYGMTTGITGPDIRGLLIDIDGTPLVPLGTKDKIVRLDEDGGLTDVWTEDIDFPTDIKMIDFSNQ